MRKLAQLALIAVIGGLGGCPGDQATLDPAPIAGREPVTFRLTFAIRHETAPVLEAQTVHVTSWRQDDKTGGVQARTLVQTRHTTPAATTTELVIQRGYPLDGNEYVTFQLVATGAVTQGTATRTFDKSQASFSREADGQLIEATIPVRCRDIPER